MRGQDKTSRSLFSCVDLEERIPVRQPLRKIRQGGQLCARQPRCPVLGSLHRLLAPLDPAEALNPSESAPNPALGSFHAINKAPDFPNGNLKKLRDPYRKLQMTLRYYFELSSRKS